MNMDGTNMTEQDKKYLEMIEEAKKEREANISWIKFPKGVPTTVGTVGNFYKEELK